MPKVRYALDWTAADLRLVVSIQQPSTVQSSSGATGPTWTEFARVRAGFRALTGREFLASGERQVMVSGRFGIRYLEGLTPAMRIVWDNRWFDIRGILLDRGLKRGAFVTVMVEERVGVAP